jgi:hypothetical protein
MDNTAAGRGTADMDTGTVDMARRRAAVVTWHPAPERRWEPPESRSAALTAEPHWERPPAPAEERLPSSQVRRFAQRPSPQSPKSRPRPTRGDIP